MLKAGIYERAIDELWQAKHTYLKKQGRIDSQTDLSLKALYSRELMASLKEAPFLSVPPEDENVKGFGRGASSWFEGLSRIKHGETTVRLDPETRYFFAYCGDLLVIADGPIGDIYLDNEQALVGLYHSGHRTYAE